MSITDLVPQQDARSTRGRVPIFRPLLNGEEFDITVREATINLSENAHDQVVMSCTSASLTDTEGLIGSTLSFFYGQAPRTELFCGYIVNVSVVQAGQGNLQFSLVVLGPTQIMQEGVPRFWTNHTIPQVVQKLAYIKGLGFYSHPHDFVWKALAQTEETYWRRAVDFTVRIGWVLFNRYGVLLCYDPNKLFRESGSYATLVSSQNREFEPAEDRRMIEFTPAETSDEIPENMGRQIAYFTDTSQVPQVVQERGSFKKYKFLTSFVIRNYEEAQLYADAGANQVTEWNQRAQARMWGDTDIYPGMCVDVITADTTHYRSKYDGRWLVVRVGHKMDTQQFQTMLALARPSSAAPISQDGYRPFWQVAGQPRPTLSLVDKDWVSSWTDPRARTAL